MAGQQGPGRWAVSLSEALDAVPHEGTPFARLIRHGTLLVGLYTPHGSDPQEPHPQDEVYFVHSGRGSFIRGDEREAFGPGDALFVPAHVPHRFEDFSDDLLVWVAFYGPPGGESLD